MKKILYVVIFLAIACMVFLAGSWYGRDKNSGSNTPAEREILYYTDPMNPGFRSEKPGTAPCGMPLEPVYAEAGDAPGTVVLGAPPESPGAVQVSAARQQLIGLHVDTVEPGPMTYTLRLYGRIVSDETRVYRLNASTDSWVRALSNTITGSIVAKDQVLAEVLAPAFYNAQVTYLVALNNIDRIREQMGGELRHQQTEIADNQIRAAVQNLQNLGITDTQVEELANSRKAQPLMQVRSPVNGVILDRDITLYQWFKAGEEFYSIADLGKVWVYADVYEDEAMYLRPGMNVQVTHPQTGRTYDARVSPILPLFDPLAKTLKVQLEVDNPRLALRPDMFVDVEIPITLPPSLHVPADSVIDSGTKKVVFVDIGNSTFEPRVVKTGWRLGREIEITEGLMPGEKVIVSGNFLVDSESRMKTAAAGFHGTTSRDPVCGMYVDEEKAKMSGRIAAYGGRTYYFCMVQCKESFEEEPEKYVPEAAVSGSEENPDPSTLKEQDWLDALEHLQGGKFFKEGEILPQNGMKDTIGRPATFPGVVDWDGPNPKKEGEPPRDWTGWGKFPGAEYLGLGKETEKKFPEEDDASETGNVNESADESPAPADPGKISAPASAADPMKMQEEMDLDPAAAQPEAAPGR